MCLVQDLLNIFFGMPMGQIPVAATCGHRASRLTPFSVELSGQLRLRLSDFQ
jgi:hypothetical protein